MKLTRIITAATILLATSLTAPVMAQAQIELSDPQPIVIGQSFNLQSGILGNEREINISLPMGYDEREEAFPVLYVIDGGVEQDFPHISGLGQLAFISGQYSELIIIGLRTGNRVAELTDTPNLKVIKEKYPDAGQSASFRRHILEEVIPYIEANYRTGSKRAIIGESLAGLFIAETFLKSPQSFDDYICVSPSLWWDDLKLAKASEALIAEADFSGRRFYVTMADEGGEMQEGLDIVLANLAAAEPEDLEWKYVDRRKTEHHNTIYHPAALDALRWLYAPEEE